MNVVDILYLHKCKKNRDKVKMSITNHEFKSKKKPSHL